jgi:hypothetical protein
MAQVTVSLPTEDEIRAMFQPYIEAVQEVAVDAFRIIKDKAILDNEDVDGNQMPPKVPKPKNNPQNFPNMPLIQNTDPDLMNNSRSTVENTDDGAVIIYDPPEHLQYLLEKPQVEAKGKGHSPNESGGRHWIKTDGTINPNARKEIEDLIKDAIAKL